MISERPRGSDEAYFTYVKKADDPGLRRGRLYQQRERFDFKLVSKKIKALLTSAFKSKTSDHNFL